MFFHKYKISPLSTGVIVIDSKMNVFHEYTISPLRGLGGGNCNIVN